MKKTLGLAIVFVFVLLNPRYIIASDQKTDNKSRLQEILVTTSDLDRDYEELGWAHASKRSIFSVTRKHLNKILRRKVSKQYPLADAIIHVRYMPVVVAEGVLDFETGQEVSGTVVRFVKKDLQDDFVIAKNDTPDMLGDAKLMRKENGVRNKVPELRKKREKSGDIVFTSDLHNVGGPELGCELYSIKKDGSNLRRITNNDYFEFHADVSPVRPEIVTVTLFEEGSDPNGELDRESELVIWDFDGNIVKQLTSNHRPESVPHWSPDGERIVFFAGLRVGGLNIFIINRDGTHEIQLTHGGVDVDPSFTPTGEIIFSRGNRIMIMNSDGSHLKALASLKITPEDPVFIDNNTIAFETKTGAKGNWGFGDYDIFLIDKDGTNLRDISQNSFVDGMPQPVGKNITFWRITDQPGTQLMIMNKDGSQQRSVFSQISNNQMPTGVQ